MKKIVILSVIFLLNGLSCKKKEDPAPQVPLTPHEILMSKKWRLWETIQNTSYVIQKGVYRTTNTIEDCVRDNYTTYGNKGSFTYHDAGIPCNPKRDNGGAYYLSKDAKIITVNGKEFKVLKLTPKVLIYGNYDYTVINETTYLSEDSIPSF